MSEEAIDSGMDAETVAAAEMLWANLPTGRKWTSLPTHEKALVCHTVARLTRPAPKADGLVEEAAGLFARLDGHMNADETELVDTILAALSDRDVVLEEAAERAAFVAGYRAAHMVPDAYDSTSAAEEAWEGYRLVSRNLKERV